MDKRSTIEEKPDTIFTHQARPRTRNPNNGNDTIDSDEMLQQSLYRHSAMPAATQPVINVFPPWNTSSAPHPITYVQLSQPTNLSPPAPSTLPYRTPSPQPTNTSGSSTSILNSGTLRSQSTPAVVLNTKSIDPMLSLPTIANWFKFTAQRVKKPPPGVESWVELGTKLENEGFVDISQISTNWIEVSKLQQMLGIQFRTAIYIFQSIEHDIPAIQAGNLVIPEEL
ncbi:hypothetical protein L210DRAFT_880235 [Boletus edulis BED1]|uniref:Uncharacterized protein n=1 Tax=Boletus edulis BED1 TaxID=1328754 RepID=A0AAD4BYQ2_BOLED|nr:hypothetical protein L210DRAFT_880235 [Boletus edulis BED1]